MSRALTAFMTGYLQKAAEDDSRHLVRNALLWQGSMLPITVGQGMYGNKAVLSAPVANRPFMKELLRAYRRGHGGKSPIITGQTFVDMMGPFYEPSVTNTINIAPGKIRTVPLDQARAAAEQANLNKHFLLKHLLDPSRKYTRKMPNEGILAHEMGHTFQRPLVINPILKHLQSVSKMGPTAMALPVLWTKDEDKARRYAATGSALTVPLLGLEGHASWKGMRLMAKANAALKAAGKEKNMIKGMARFRSFAGIPTYMTAALIPWMAYMVKKTRGDYGKQKGIGNPADESNLAENITT